MKARITRRASLLLPLTVALATMVWTLRPDTSVDTQATRSAESDRPVPHRYLPGATDTVLEGASHVASFDERGLHFLPDAGPGWHWGVETIRGGAQMLVDGSVDPELGGDIVSYEHDAIREEYHARPGGVQQRFVIDEPLDLDGGDLVIEGHIASSGTFRERLRRWQWSNEDGTVTLGDVTVFDADGDKLLASMEVDEDGTRILVDGDALADADYPVTIDPEVGTNDTRLSDVAGSGTTDRRARRPVVAHSATSNLYLTVWEADDSDFGNPDDEFDIFGQLVRGADVIAGPMEVTTEIGVDFRISSQGGSPSVNDGTHGTHAAVAWNSAADEFLVVWRAGSRFVGGVLEYEVFGQRIDGATGSLIGANFRISNAGADGDASVNVLEPAVDYDSVNDRYLVVWSTDGNSTDNKFSIWGQILRPDGTQEDLTTGAPDTRDDLIARMPSGVWYVARQPALAYDATNDGFLVVWTADTLSPTMTNNENEIWGQRVAYLVGKMGGKVRYSDMGVDGNASINAIFPGVAYNATDDTFLIVWTADEDANPAYPSLVDQKYEVWGQRVAAATGAEVGANDFRISFTGTDSDPLSDGLWPVVTWDSNPADPASNEWFVAYDCDDTVDEVEICGVRVAGATGTPGPVIRLSDMGPDLDTSFAATGAGVAYNAHYDEVLAVWSGDDLAPPLGDGEFEIHGQLWGDDAPADADGDLFRAEDDCDDTNADVYPGAPELCDGLSNDCDAPDWPAPPADELDDDGDGYILCADASFVDQGIGLLGGDDCNDAMAWANPGATEVCDGYDTDCSTGDATTPEDAAELDDDGDSYVECTGFVDQDLDDAWVGGDDCDDTDALIGPGWFQDADLDGFGEPASPHPSNPSCADPGSGWVQNNLDMCPGFDDLLDDDGDTMPDGCDTCDGFDDLADVDGDGAPDECDICPGYDDALDSDLDGVPDGCEIGEFTVWGDILLEANSDHTGYMVNGTGAPSVTYDTDLNRYIMAFEVRLPSTDPNCPVGMWGIGVATSNDGVTNWTTHTDVVIGPNPGSYYACVAAHPSIAYLPAPTRAVLVYFKAEEEEPPLLGASRYTGVGAAQINLLPGGGIDSVQVGANPALDVGQNFGMPKVVRVGTDYEMMLTLRPDAYMASSTDGANFTMDPSPVLSPATNNMPYWALDELFNGALVCDEDPTYPYSAFIGGNDLGHGASVLAAGWGKAVATDPSTWFLGSTPYIEWAGSDDWKHWDVLRVSTTDYLVYFDEKDGTGKNRIRIATTTPTWSDNDVYGKYCP